MCSGSAQPSAPVGHYCFVFEEEIGNGAACEQLILVGLPGEAIADKRKTYKDTGEQKKQPEP